MAENGFDRDGQVVQNPLGLDFCVELDAPGSFWDLALIGASAIGFFNVSAPSVEC